MLKQHKATNTESRKSYFWKGLKIVALLVLCCYLNGEQQNVRHLNIPNEFCPFNYNFRMQAVGTFYFMENFHLSGIHTYAFSTHM